jgi:hypothetical protein
MYGTLSLNVPCKRQIENFSESLDREAPELAGIQLALSIDLIMAPAG